MVPLADAASPFEAKVLAARLGAEGIVWQLRGHVDSVYPVGGGVEVLVAEPDLDRAREVLLVDEVEAAFAGAGDEPGRPLDRAGDRRADLVFGTVLVALVVVFLAARLLALG